MIKEKLIALIESVEVNGFSRKVSRFSIEKTKKEGWLDKVYIGLKTDFVSETGEDPVDEDKLYNKWYFRFYNKFINEFTDSDEDYISMCDNNTKVNFYTDWVSKLEYDIRGIYLWVNLAEMEAYLRDKKINKLLE